MATRELLTVLLQAAMACVPALAQREVPMPAATPPAAADAVIAGNRLPRTVTCHDHIHVYIRGERNEVQVYGDCGLVRLEGSRNFVWVDRDAQVAVLGSNNVIYICTSTTRVSSQGTGNRFELRP